MMPERYMVDLARPAPVLVWRRSTDARGRVTWCGYRHGRAFAAVYTYAGALVLEIARADQPPHSERCTRVSAAKRRAAELAGGGP